MDGTVILFERRLDRGSAEPLGAQLTRALRTALLGGELRPGDALPSTRALAERLGLSRGLVVAAYEQLAGEGYLETRQGAPSRVAAFATPGPAEPASPPAEAAPPAGAAAAIDLLPGHPSTARLDEAAWRAAWRHAAALPVPHALAPPEGEARLRAALAEHLRHARGVVARPDELVVAAGTGDAVALLAGALAARLGRPPRVAIEHPGYPSARRILARHGAELVPVPAEGDGLDPRVLRALDPAPDAVMLTPSHQYPLGGRLPVAARLGLLDWAGGTGGVLVEDDYDSEFRHAGPTLPALASLDGGGRTVLVGSLSKVLTPALRLGYLLVRDPALRERMLEARAETANPVPVVAQHAIARLLETGALRRHIGRVRRDYAHRRRLVQAALAPWADRLQGLDGGLHAVVRLPDAGSAARVVARLARAGVVVASLGDYAADGSGGPHGIVLGYGAASDARLAAALEAVAAALRAELG